MSASRKCLKLFLIVEKNKEPTPKFRFFFGRIIFQLSLVFLSLSIAPSPSVCEPFKLIDDVKERKQKNQETIKHKSNAQTPQRTDLTNDNY